MMRYSIDGKRYEYSLVEYAKYDFAANSLNDLGKQGWIVATSMVDPSSPYKFKYTLFRVLEEGSPEVLVEG